MCWSQSRFVTLSSDELFARRSAAAEALGLAGLLDDDGLARLAARPDRLHTSECVQKMGTMTMTTSTGMPDGWSEATAPQWLNFFAEKDRLTFVAEFTKLLAACASVHEFRPLLMLVAQWQNTAFAIAVGADLTSPIVGDGGDAPRPRSLRGRGREK